MVSDMYTIAVPSGLRMRHFYPADEAELLVCDREITNQYLDANVRSGDYFITLITDLEIVLERLPKRELTARLILEKLVDDLGYINSKYTITKKID